MNSWLARSSSLWVSLILAIVVAAPFVEAEESATPRPTALPEDSPVMPLTLPAPKVDLQGVDQRIYLVLEKLAHSQRILVHPWSEDPSLLLLTESRSDEHWIRPNTSAVEGFCFLYRFGPYDAEIVGATRSELLQKTILPMMRYLVATHVTGTRPTSDGQPWGNAWQSAHWTQQFAHGAWWIWDDLPKDLRTAVRRVVAHEADRIASLKPPHQIPLNTKAEENAWNSEVLEVAVLLMPNDPRRAVWDAAFQKWALSSFLRPADEKCQKIVDGQTVAKQFTGANIHDDFTLENHGIVHPDYMMCFALSADVLPDYALTGRRPPEAVLYNAPEIYEKLKWLSLPSGNLAYPNGEDWELFRCFEWIYPHLLMAVYARDPDAWSLVLQGLETLEKMQARFPSGDPLAPGEWFFPSSHGLMMVALPQAWLALQTADRIERSPRERLGVLRLDSGKILVRRTPKAIHTFSWGNRLMAQCIPNRRDAMVSPHPSSGIGHITQKNAKGPLPLTIENVEVTSGSDSFHAKVTIEHGKNQIRGELEFHSSPNGDWLMREKLVALSDVTTSEIATGMIGVLNNPRWVWEKGVRHIRCDGREETVPGLSGKTICVDACRGVEIDSVFSIRSPNPLSIRYIGATKPERGRATDELYLNYHGDEHTWRKGDTISEYEVTIHCH